MVSKNAPRQKDDAIRVAFLRPGDAAKFDALAARIRAGTGDGSDDEDGDDSGFMTTTTSSSYAAMDTLLDELKRAETSIKKGEWHDAFVSVLGTALVGMQLDFWKMKSVWAKVLARTDAEIGADPERKRAAVGAANELGEALKEMGYKTRLAF